MCLLSLIEMNKAKYEFLRILVISILWFYTWVSFTTLRSLFIHVSYLDVFFICMNPLVLTQVSVELYHLRDRQFLISTLVILINYWSLDVCFPLYLIVFPL